MDPTVAGALIGLGGAAVAAVTALATQYLAGRREDQRAALLTARDEQRIEQQLRHERRLREDDAARHVLDDALAAAHGAIDAAEEYKRIVEAGAALAENPQYIETKFGQQLVEAVMRAGSDYLPSTNRLALIRSRVMIQFGTGHDLTVAWLYLERAILPLALNRPSVPEVTDIANDRMVTFAQLAHEWSSRPPD